MKIAIASGKGGTGKTTVAVNLAWVAAREGVQVTYLDCDVEEPNGHIFLKPEIQSVIPVGIPVPEVDKAQCDSCGACAKICQYSAIICLADQVLVFPEMCHGCGGCTLVCPKGAIREVERQIGLVEVGISGKISFVQGKLDVGQAMSPPLIRGVKKRMEGEGLYIIDSPPGTSCPVIESVRGADFTILVTEPTPFGLNDLKLAVGMLRALKQPFGIVINRCDMGNDETVKYCRSEALQVLLSIPDDRKIAEAYSRGHSAVEALPEYQRAFRELLERVCGKGGAA